MFTLKILGRPRPRLWCALTRLDESLARVKIWGASAPWAPKCSLLKKVHLGRLTLTTISFLLVDQSSPIFLRPIVAGLWLITQLSDFRYVDPFRRYSRSKLKVVKNQAKFWTFLPSQILLGVPLPKLVSMLSPTPRATYLVKFREVMTTTHKVIGVNTLNFKPNFKCSPIKFLREPPIRFMVCASKPCQSVNRVKISGSCTP